MSRGLVATAFLVWLVVTPGVGLTKSLTVKIDAASLRVGGSADRGAFSVASFPVPSEVIGMRLDTVLLEFYVDVSAHRSIDGDYSPVIEVFPLSDAYQAGLSPSFETAYPTSRPITIGERQRVVIDVTDIVKSWIATPARNHGLIIGSFRGPRVGDLNVRGDMIGDGKAIQATFFYQNRFGEPVSKAR